MGCRRRGPEACLPGSRGVKGQERVVSPPERMGSLNGRFHGIMPP